MMGGAQNEKTSFYSDSQGHFTFQSIRRASLSLKIMMTAGGQIVACSTYARAAAKCSHEKVYLLEY